MADDWVARLWKDYGDDDGSPSEESIEMQENLDRWRGRWPAFTALPRHGIDEPHLRSEMDRRDGDVVDADIAQIVAAAYTLLELKLRDATRDQGRWSSQPPTEGGVYWMRRLCRVEDNHPHPQPYIRTWVPGNYCLPHTEWWSVPVTPPEDHDTPKESRT